MEDCYVNYVKNSQNSIRANELNDKKGHNTLPVTVVMHSM